MYGNTTVAQAAHSVEAPAHYWSCSDTPSGPDDFDPSTLPWGGSVPPVAQLIQCVYLDPIAATRHCQGNGGPGTITGRHTEPPARTCGQAGGATPPTNTTALPGLHKRSITWRTCRDQGRPAPSIERGSAPHQTTAATLSDASTQTEELPGNTHPQPTETPSSTRNQAPRDPVSTDGRHHALNQMRPDPEPHPHRGSPARPTAPIPPVSPLAPGPTTSTPALARAGAPHTDAPTKAQRHEPQPTVRQPQGSTLAETLSGARHQATTAGPTGVPASARTQSTTDTADCAPPGPSDPETHFGELTTANTGALPTPPSIPGRATSTVKARARPQEEAEGYSCKEPDSQCTEQMTVVATYEATIPATHLAVRVLLWTHPTLTGTIRLRAAHRSGTEPCSSCETPGTDRPGTDEEGPRDPQEPTPEHTPKNPLTPLCHHRPQPWVTTPNIALLWTKASTPEHRPRPPQNGRTLRGGTLPTGHPQARGGDIYHPDNRGHRTHRGWRTRDPTNT